MTPIDPQLDAALDDAIALIKYKIEYRDIHGGAPPEVKAIKRHGVADAKARLAEIVGEREAAARFDEVDNMRGLDLLGTMQRIERTHDYIERRISALRQQKSKDKGNGE